MLHKVSYVTVKDICSAQDDCNRDCPEQLDNHHCGKRKDPHREPLWVDQIEGHQGDEPKDKTSKACADRCEGKHNLREDNLLHDLPHLANRFCRAADCLSEPSPRKDCRKEEEWECRLWPSENDTNEHVINCELQGGVND